jgi:hypothetical protein
VVASTDRRIEQVRISAIEDDRQAGQGQH